MSEPEITEADVARYWDANAGPWAAEVRQGHDVAREWLNNPAFLDFVGDLRGRDVLDAGCGEGYNTRLLAGAGARLTGIDLSERMIELATAEERRAPLGIRYLRTSYAELGMLADASFDAVSRSWLSWTGRASARPSVRSFACCARAVSSPSASRIRASSPRARTGTTTRRGKR